MANWSYFYLFHIEYLGFRFHGWQKQTNAKTVHGMIDKTFNFVLGHTNYRTLGCGRTDAKVSADDYAFELFTREKMDAEELMKNLNFNLPADIRIKTVQVVDAKFNIIKSAQSKEYHYHFSHGMKSHPFNAPFIRCFEEELDIKKMQEAARHFVGTHNFKRYVVKPSPITVFEREIFSSIIETSSKYTSPFTPSKAFVFKVKAKGFMRYQVRLMMGALIDVGSGKWTLEEFKQSLIDVDAEHTKHVAPSSGLVLHRVEY